MIESRDAATLALHSCLKRLKQDVGKAVKCLTDLPSIASSCASNSGQTPQEVGSKLSLAFVEAQDALDEQEAACARLQEINSNQQTPQQDQDMNEIHSNLRENCIRTSLYQALDQLQQAASAGMSSARAAVRSAYAGSAVDMQQMFDVLMNLAESVVQAQTILRQYANSCAVHVRIVDRTNNTAAAAAANTNTQQQQQQQGRHQQQQQQQNKPCILEGNAAAASPATAAVAHGTAGRAAAAADVKDPAAGNLTRDQQQQQQQQSGGPDTFEQQAADGKVKQIGVESRAAAAAMESKRTFGGIRKGGTQPAAAAQPAVARHQTSAQPHTAATAGRKRHAATQHDTTATVHQASNSRLQEAAAQGKRQKKSSTPVPQQEPPPAAAAAAAAAEIVGTVPQQVMSTATASEKPSALHDYPYAPPADVSQRRTRTASRMAASTSEPQPPPSSYRGARKATGCVGVDAAATATGVNAAAVVAPQGQNPAAQARGTVAEARKTPAGPTTAPAAAAAVSAQGPDAAAAAGGAHGEFEALLWQLSDVRTAKTAAKKLGRQVRDSLATGSATTAASQAIQGLLQVLDSRMKADVRFAAAAQLLEIVTGSEAGQTAVAAAGGVQRLSHCISSSSSGSCGGGSSSRAAGKGRKSPCTGDDVGQQAAVILLCLVFEHEGNARAAAAAAECIAAVCQLMQNAATATNAARTIRELAPYCTAETAQQLISALVDTVKIQILTSDSEAVTEAANALSDFCNSSNANASHNQTLLAAAGGIQVLSQLLRDAAACSSSGTAPMQQLQEAAARALGCAIHESAANRAAVAAADGIEPLVHLLFSSSTQVQEAAAQALYFTALDCSENKAAVAAAQAELPFHN